MNVLKNEPLPRAFYERDVAAVARELLGKTIVRATREGTTLGRIVETEAYLARGDSACHASRGRTPKNNSMFGPPGRAYVYSIHARYCFNAVTEPRGTPSAVLIRAIEPLAGIPLMRRRRGKEAVVELARGPARLCEALSIDRRLDGWDLTRGRRMWIADGDVAPVQSLTIAQSPRIGVTSAANLALRFFVADCKFVCPFRGTARLGRQPSS